jgi:hypothetical protein
MGNIAAGIPDISTGRAPIAPGDLPAQPGRDGWSPAELRVVQSRHRGSFPGATLRFAFGGVQEHRGQRLTTAQIDTFAPYFAKEYGMSEAFVRSELGKVYLYTGGPSAMQNAMTIGHHVFLPDENSLRAFESPTNRRWMAHELSHVMQFDAEHGRNVPRYLADYVSGFVVSRAPDTGPGHSDTGRPVWGSLFTALQMSGKREDQLGAPPRSLRDRMVTGAVPGGVIAGTGGMISGGLLAATAASRGGAAPLGLRAPFRTGAALFAVPAAAGAAIGMAGGPLGIGTATALGGAAGAVGAAGILGAAGAFAARSPLHLAGVAGLVAGGAVLGASMANITASTARGWSPTTDTRTKHGTDVRGGAYSWDEALHDGHWYELDAEASARQFLRGEQPPDTGRADTPSNTTTPGRTALDRLDWGLKIPLILGIPTAGGIGAGVLGARTLRELARGAGATRQPGRTAVADALFALGRARRGVGNSFAIGGAVALAPLVAGGIAGQFSGALRGRETLGGSIGGAVAGAGVGGALLRMCLAGRGGGAGRTAWTIAGTALSGVLGTVAGSAAANALHPHERTYLDD